MTTSRRKFLEAGIVTSIVAGATLKCTTLAATADTSNTGTFIRASSIEYYNKSAFESYINSDFRVANVPRETWLRLVLVEDFPMAESGSAPRECFRLLFSGSISSSLGQGTYQFEHSALGTFPMFIVPGNPVDGKTRYEAVFNRLTQTVAPTAPNAKKSKKAVLQWEIDTVTPDFGTTKTSKAPGLKLIDR